jgi:hypothetical protein
VYDHLSAVPLFERSHPEVWVGEFGDTVVCMVPSNVENQRWTGSSARSSRSSTVPPTSWPTSAPARHCWTERKRAVRHRRR